jgi:hypothetical protein
MRNNEEQRTNNKRKGLAAIRSLFVLCSVLFLASTEASADIVVFKNGRTMSVKSLRIDADMATMQLRDGGEVTFPASVVAQVHPDEVPYPEPGIGSREPGCFTR